MTEGDTELLQDLREKIKDLQHQAELIKTVLMVKDPNSVQAFQGYEGLRRQVIAGAAERRSHLTQLASMAVAIHRATAVKDLVPQITEWMDQSGLLRVRAAPPDKHPADYFEDVAGAGLEGPLEIIEPAYVDAQTNQVMRLGRARLRPAPIVATATERTVAPTPVPAAEAATTPQPPVPHNVTPQETA